MEHCLDNATEHVKNIFGSAPSFDTSNLKKIPSYIVVEGPDGSGKDTIVEYLKETHHLPYLSIHPLHPTLL